MVLGDIIAATGAGVVTTVVGHPLDTIKVHLQANRTKQTAWQVAKDLFRQNMLFRGIGPPIVNAVVMNACMFSVFSSIKSYLADETSSTSTATSASSSLLAGLISGFATACISTPTDFIKVQAQLNGIQQLAYMRTIPLHMMLRGHVANLAREGVFTAAYLGVYDLMHPAGFWQVAAAASVTGGFAWIVSYPFDTIKTVRQARPELGYREILQMTRGNLFRGCATSTGRAIMVTSLRMIVYDLIIHGIDEDGSFFT
uniref:Uncharacterized protein n=1 Tax=Craspedostauros australis TaxID=1486917 RepID=A0A7R9ZMX7_9STRA|mmetsp:Transcript_21063/g.58601  ORF Transcript_21063/g.58601 Transcript_21063/m.58601 type:complete len:256 (+) Transcript_21063:657-1424(+)